MARLTNRDHWGAGEDRSPMVAARNLRCGMVRRPYHNRVGHSLPPLAGLLSEAAKHPRIGVNINDLPTAPQGASYGLLVTTAPANRVA